MTNDFPFLTANYKTPTADLPLFKDYAWDFDSNSFICDEKGNPITLTGNDALKIWIEKCFRTERDAFLAYDSSYGFSKKKFFARVMSVQERRAALRKEIKDALLVNPYIISVDSISFSESNHSLNLDINIVLQTIYGELRV